jgi:hypothetical protein
MKKLIILGLVIVLLAVSALPAVAKRVVTTEDGCGIPPTQVNKKYALAGWIRAIDLADKKVTVLVAVGNVLAKPCINQEVVISVNEETILKVSGGTPIDFSKLKINDPVSSTGFLSADGWNALQITLGAILASKDLPY